ncbi:MAG: hypothetical protein GX242_00555 [Clostridiales bacterium]|nr:hypothetical protein [Clostridiales bacterium]
MKKRIFDRILAVIGIFLAVCFAAVLLVTIFGGIDYKEFDNSLVKSLFVAMAALYVAISILTIINLFSDGDVVKEIALDRSRSGSTKATAPVIKSLTRKYIKAIEGVKCTKITLVLTEYGVNLRINLKVKDLEVKETTTYIKKLLDNVFETTLDYKFHSIDFKVQSLKSKYQPPTEQLLEESQKEVEKLRQLKLQKEAEQKAKEAEMEAKIMEENKELDNASNDNESIVNDKDLEKDDTEEEQIVEEYVIENDVPPMNTEHKDFEIEELDTEHFPRT